MLIPEAPQSFIYTVLTEQQQVEGQILSDNQVLVIQNERAKIAEQLLSLSYDPANPFKFAQDQAFLQGQLYMFMWLLNASTAARSVLLEIAQRSAGTSTQDPDQFN